MINSDLHFTLFVDNFQYSIILLARVYWWIPMKVLSKLNSTRSIITKEANPKFSVKRDVSLCNRNVLHHKVHNTIILWYGKNRSQNCFEDIQWRITRTFLCLWTWFISVNRRVAPASDQSARLCAIPPPSPLPLPTRTLVSYTKLYQLIFQLTCIYNARFHLMLCTDRELWSLWMLSSKFVLYTFWIQTQLLIKFDSAPEHLVW